MRTGLAVATAIGGVLGAAASIWMKLVVFPRDAQAPIAVIYLAPIATTAGASIVGIAQPSLREAARAAAIVYACVWLPLLATSPAGIVLACLLAIPTALLVAPTVAVTRLLSELIWELRSPS